MKSIQTIQWTTMLAAAFLLLGCNDDDGAGQQAGMNAAKVSVQTMQRSDVPVALEVPARLSGNKEVEVRARVAGIIEQRNFDEGSMVEAGSSLFTLDLKPFKVAFNTAEANLQAAQARVQQAEREVQRLQPLRANNSVSQRSLDDAIAARDVAIAEKKVAQSQLEEAELNLQYARVRSPVSGVVGREQISEGSYVAGPAELLTRVTELHPMRVRFGLSEREQLAMRQDAHAGLITLPEDGHWSARLTLADGSAYGHDGEVNFQDVRVNPHTGTSELQALIPNPEKQLRPGQFVRVRLEGAVRHDAFVVPQRAVLDSGRGKFVYLVGQNEQGHTIAQPQPVKVGEWVRQSQRNEVMNGWVIREGLSDGDRVVVDGMARIFFPGMPIEVTDGKREGGA